MKRIFVVLTMIMGMHSYSHAGLLLEPYIGYQAMVTSLTTGSSLLSLPLKLDATGTGVGLRFGYSGMLAFAAFDYSAASLATKQTSGVALIASGTTLHTELGATVGLNLPIIRPYAGYIFDDEYIASTSRFIGTGYKVGIGFSIFPMVKLNAEYHSIKYSKYKTTTEVTLPNAATYDSASMAGVMVNVSIPL